MMLKLKSVRTLAVVAATLSAPAFAQNTADSAETYTAGVDLGRTLHDPAQCTGRGEYYEGCVDGVTESQFDRQADQALDSGMSDAKPPQPAPLLSPPPGMFQEPFAKPGDTAPPGN